MKEEVESQVVTDFKQWLNANDKGQAVAVGAIHALTNLVRTSNARTIMELEIVLKNAQEQLQKVINVLAFQIREHMLFEVITILLESISNSLNFSRSDSKGSAPN